MTEHRTPRVALLIAALSAILGVSDAQPRQNDPQMAGLISGVIDAYGGEKALRAVHGYHASGEQWAVQRREPMRVERWFGRPDRLRLELSYPDHHETRVTDGAQGWTGSGIESLEPTNPVRLMAMRLQTIRLDVPLRLLEQRDEVERRDADAQGRIVLRIPIDEGLLIDYHIDPKTFRITRMTTIMTRPSMEFVTEYDLFHEIDGVLIAFKETTYAGGTLASEFHMTEFEWNPKDLDSRLRPGIGNWD